ncbi:T9SS type A sorting domain-containing protein [Phaeocystidibacter luteus]|nr:DUF4397 domain-containing protein [Phaeocystidibacter luteus]
MRKLLTLFAIAATTAASAQTARVQVIHNSADLAADSVDVYLGSQLLLDDFAFRSATPFVNLTAGSPITIGIAPKNSIDVSDTIYSLTATLTPNETYVVVANGIVSGSGYSPAPAFDLYIQPMGREAASMMGNTDILVFHGSTDAPSVSVDVVGLGNVVDTLDYGDFAGYLEVPTSDITLEVRSLDGSTVLAAYDAPLSTLGLQDSALVAVASGFFDPSMNSMGEGFGIWVALPNGGPLIELPVASSANPTARVQVIHNSADLAADSVDVYLGSTLLLDNFAFRTATPFIDAPATDPITIGIAPKNSSDVTDTIYSLTATLTENETYVIVANGIVSGSGYSPAPAFDLYINAMGREAASMSGNTDVLVFHGSTDAPNVSIDVAGVGNVVDTLAYGDFAGYLEVATADITLEVRSEDGATLFASYDAPLSTLGLQDSALVTLASGFLNPANNSSGAGFGLWVALPNGGPLIELPVNSGLSVDEFGTNELTIYPNPASDFITIEGIEATSASLIDITGQTVRNWENSVEELNIQGLQPGVYLLRVESNGERFTERVVIR